MSVLLLYSDYSRGIVDYTETLYSRILTADDQILKLPRLHLFEQEPSRDYLSHVLETYHQDIVHIQYDSKMFKTGDCEYEHLENFIWFLQEIHSSGRVAVITYHGIINYNNQKSHGIIDKYRLKILRNLFNTELVPLLNKSRVVVHSYYHQEEMEKQGITNTYVIPPGLERHSLQSIPVSNSDNIKLVIPGQRAKYKNYGAAIYGLKKFPDRTSLYISDEASEDYSDASISKLADKAHVLNRTRFASFPRSKNDYLDHLATYDCALLPYTDTVPSSGSLQDCLSVGLPCITFSNREMNDLRDQQNCIYSAEDFSQTAGMYINRLIYDSSHREQMVKNINNYHEFRSWDVCKTRYDDLYNPKSAQYIPTPQGADRINVFMCCRDVSETIERTFSRLTAAEDRLRESNPGWSNTEFHYYILENDSVDNTPGMLAEFFDSKLGQYSTGTVGAEKWGSHPGAARMRDMASYRNSMKELCTDWRNSRYSFIVDAEIEFDVAIMDKQIKYLQEHNDVAMVTPFGTVDMSNIYYDKFAFRDIQNMNDTLPVITGSSVEVKSAFSGFVCIRTPVLERCRWDVVNGETSEHVPFCNMVNRHGKIIIDSTVVVRW